MALCSLTNQPPVLRLFPGLSVGFLVCVQGDYLTIQTLYTLLCIDQGLSKHQEVSSTSVTKLTKFIVVFWDLLGSIKR